MIARTDSPRHAVVVSLYEARPFEPLAELFESMAAHDAGLPYQVVLVVNRTSSGALQVPSMPGMQILERENTGMNIGAWNHGFRHAPGYNAYLFLQDECVVQRDGWLAAFERRATKDVGLVGESLNLGWDKPWPRLRETHGKTPMREHVLNGEPANRVDVYLDMMRRSGIEPGDTGRHLRSLVWFARRDWLERINGFPLGADFGQCIGAEIGVSRAVIALGGEIAQVAEQPFHYIRHAEWHQAVAGGPYVHGPAPAQAPRHSDAGEWRRRLKTLGARWRGLWGGRHG